MEDRYYVLISLSVLWLLFYFLVAYSLNDKRTTFHKFAFFTIINAIFIMLCYVLLTTNLELENKIEILKTEIKNGKE